MNETPSDFWADPSPEVWEKFLKDLAEAADLREEAPAPIQWKINTWPD